MISQKRREGPGRGRGLKGGSEAESPKTPFCRSSAPTTARETGPRALCTCSAMIPKSPKQAYCTKFLLNTRTQPAGKEKGRGQGAVGESRRRDTTGTWPPHLSPEQRQPHHPPQGQSNFQENQ